MRNGFAGLLILTMLALMPGEAFSALELANKKEKPLELVVETDKTKINIGDQIKLGIIAENPASYKILFPETPSNLGDFTFIKSYPMKQRAKGKGQRAGTGYVYVLTIYDTGTHVIPPIKVEYRKENEERAYSVESPQVAIEVVSLLKDTDTDIKDIKGLAAYRTHLPFLAIILTALFIGIILAGWAYWRMGKGARSKEQRAKTAYEVAYEELKKLKAMNLPAKGLIKEYYIRLSDIVRRYLEDRFFFRAPEMTTEEFLDAIKKSLVLIDDHKRLLREFLSHCDMVKFAKYGPTPLEMLDSYNAAERLIDQTRPIEPKEGETVE